MLGQPVIDLDDGTWPGIGMPDQEIEVGAGRRTNRALLIKWHGRPVPTWCSVFCGICLRRCRFCADPERRWVKVSCGHLSGSSAATAPAAPGAQGKPAGSGKPEYVFALSWQSAFCETKSNKTECRAQNPNEFDATNFTLHGLWPQP